jgi:hypothetical protein
MMVTVLGGLRVEQRAELVVHGVDDTDVDLDELTRMLSITPTGSQRRGETLRSGRLAREARWWWETDQRSDPNGESLVCEVLDRFEPVASELAEAIERWNLRVGVGLVISMFGVIDQDPFSPPVANVMTPSLIFSATTLGRLAALGADLDIVQYVIAPE